MNTPAPFSQVLRAECQKDWQAAIQHRFVDEIFAGTLSSEHLRHYLVQDYQFVDRFVALLGAAIGEFADKRDLWLAGKGGIGAVAGFIVGTVAKVGAALGIVLIILAQFIVYGLA